MIIFGFAQLLSHTRLGWLGYIKIYYDPTIAARSNPETGSGGWVVLAYRDDKGRTNYPTYYSPLCLGEITSIPLTRVT